MDNFISFPVIIYNTREQESTGKNPDECELIEVDRVLDITRIESYYQSIPLSDFREDNKIWTTVVMHSGDTFIVNMPILDFELFVTRELGSIKNNK